jgi:hypothetical protein
MSQYSRWPDAAGFPAARFSIAETEAHGGGPASPGQRLPRDRARMTMEYRLIFGVCLLVFLWVALFQRLDVALRRTARVAGPRSSIWSQARDMAHSCTSIAFQG